MSVYLQTAHSLNKYWERITDAMLEMDTRPLYLLTFETALSPCLSEPLYEMSDYVKQKKEHPFPKDPCQTMNFEEFMSWKTIYEIIMRDNNLLGLLNGSDSHDEAAEDFFDDTEDE